MNGKPKSIFCWSGGKDSALCLYRVRQSGACDIVALLTTLNERYQRVSMHGVRRELLEAQAASIGLPLEMMFVGDAGTNDEYETKMRELLLRAKARGVEQVIFGDIFLEDLRRWREANLATVGLRAVFPLWKEDTGRLVREFIGLGFRSVLCCVNDAYMDCRFVGREIDEALLRDLPTGVDPCGENGEFHSFAFAGPIFQEPLPVQTGEKVYRPIEQTHPGSAVCPPADRPPTNGFWFCDLTLNTSARLRDPALQAP